MLITLLSKFNTRKAKTCSHAAYLIFKRLTSTSRYPELPSDCSAGEAVQSGARAEPRNLTQDAHLCSSPLNLQPPRLTATFPLPPSPKLPSASRQLAVACPSRFKNIVPWVPSCLGMFSSSGRCSRSRLAVPSGRRPTGSCIHTQLCRFHCSYYHFIITAIIIIIIFKIITLSRVKLFHALRIQLQFWGSTQGSKSSEIRCCRATATNQAVTSERLWAALSTLMGDEAQKESPDFDSVEGWPSARCPR